MVRKRISVDLLRISAFVWQNLCILLCKSRHNHQYRRLRGWLRHFWSSSKLSGFHCGASNRWNRRRWYIRGNGSFTPFLTSLSFNSADIYSQIVTVVHMVPLAKRPTIQALMGAVMGSATVAGPPIGGAFTTHVTWRFDSPLMASVVVSLTS